MKDEIVEEIHKHREEFASQFDYDVRKMLEYIRQQQEESGRKVVSFVEKNLKQKESENIKKVA